ncbi:melanoma antigen preferentially expressed in tumors-like [Nannospalax galili]|uniref:melanoma antigen preferentially expressed in tumors-like n=1 Tax=Nannospalax galili TaxID=1026970 RepID=UPI0004ED56BC|nr:melanoma antigen preferentially expressed in tumors-like [Nannospalax galili]
MEFKEPPTELPTLSDLVTQLLLKDEPALIQALEKIPTGLYASLFNAAFTGAHINILRQIVKIWPFPCLHMGTLTIREPQQELLKAMIESFQVTPDQSSASWCSKLRILDLRQDAVLRITCPGNNDTSSVCFHSCIYYAQSAMCIPAQCRNENAESEDHSSMQSLQIILDLSLNGTLKGREFFSLLVRKVQQSLGTLHLCCRDLKIDKLSDCKGSLSFLDLKCVDYLSVEQASLTEVTKLLTQMANLDSINLSKIICRSLTGRTFKRFTTNLKRMTSLAELNLSSFTLTNHLDCLLRVLPPTLEFLSLVFCELSNNDFRFLSQCPQTNNLKLLNVSNNPLYWEDCGPFQHLLEKNSGTLQHLEMDHCLMTDSTVSVLIPALSQCSQLRLLSFACNPISMNVLMRILQHLTPLMELSHVIYPIPVHCYRRWHLQGSIDQQMFDDIEARLKSMLEAAKRSDMNWITYSD